MIGRFARGLGHLLPAQLVAGVILLAVGTWFASEPVRHDYPEPGELVVFEGEALDARQVRRRRGALLRFLAADPLELYAVLDPGQRVVLYLNSMPRYEALMDAVASGPATYHLWDGAEDEENAMLIWRLDSGGATVVDAAETVAGLKASRARAAWLPGAIAAFGLVLALLGWRARRRAV